MQNPEQTFLQKRPGEKKNKTQPCSRQHGLFLALLGQLEVKLAWADILISTLDLVNTGKVNHSVEIFTAASLPWALGLWLSSIKVPDGRYLETSTLLLLLSPAQITAPPVSQMNKTCI